MIKKLRIPDGHLACEPINDAKAEKFCMIIAQGIHNDAIAYYVLTEDYSIKESTATKYCEEIVKTYPAINTRINYLKGLYLVEHASNNDNPLTKTELVSILTERVRDKKINVRDLVLASEKVSSLLGWDAPLKVEHTSSTLTELLAALKQNDLPSDDNTNHKIAQPSLDLHKDQNILPDN